MRRPCLVVPMTALMTAESGSTNYSVFTVKERDGKQFAQLKSVRVGETFGKSVVDRRRPYARRTNHRQPHQPTKRWKPDPGNGLGDAAMAHERNEQSMDKKQNLARFFIEQQHVAWVSLAVALLWGIYGLLNMPQRKDPDIPVRQAMVIVPWQGTSADK